MRTNARLSIDVRAAKKKKKKKKKQLIATLATVF